ncbi:UNVERIFIED_CONTAM: hypothetical protein DES50_108202 [Williamsia faeni]
MNNVVDVYFIPLPEMLPMPKNVVNHFQYDERDTPYLASTAFSGTPADLLRQNGAPLDVAIRLTLVPTAPAEIAVRTAAAVSVSEYVTGVTDSVNPVNPADLVKYSGGSMQSPRAITVAEIAVFADTESEDDKLNPIDVEIRDLPVPLLRAIDCIQHFVRAYNVLPDREPVAIPTYPRVGPMIVYGRNTAETWEHRIASLSHENNIGKPPKALNSSELRQWNSNVQLLASGDVSARFEEALADAIQLATRQGDYAGAVIASAQAAEVLLDGLLGLLLWEECGDAPHHDGPTDEAAAVLAKPLRRRLRTAYHPRLGGQWDLGREGALARWDRLVASPRNRVVHRGYRPLADEAADSLNATRELDEYLRSLLASKAREFPRTALMVVREEGLKKAGSWSRIRAFATKTAPGEPPWRDSYAQWRDRVDAETEIRQRTGSK